MKCTVSVPLRGLWFLSKRIKSGLQKIMKFPSPCGDYGSYHLIANEVWQGMKRSVSVPLRGLWFLSFFDNLDDAKAAREAFPSPCGDYGSYPLKLILTTNNL